MKLYKNIGKWLAASVLMLSTSCKDDTFDMFQDDGSDQFKVTLSIDLEGMSSQTRGDEDGKKKEEISGGSKIDMLIYAVYYENEDGDWEVAGQYGKLNDKGSEFTAFPGKHDPGRGQTILEITSFPVDINLTLKKGETYKVAFWAQSSETDAFVTEDLKKVQMKYKLMDIDPTKPDPIEDENAKELSKSLNNDEARDAFCRYIDINEEKEIGTTQRTIYLKRPLAQINVGTRGFDYETITRNAPEGKKYLYSKIRINRAARYLNVVTDEVYTSTIDSEEGTTEAFYTIDYDYNKFPAYWRTNTPSRPSYTRYDDEALLKSDKEILENNNIYEKEEFLKVHLYPHEGLSNEEKEATYTKEDDKGYYTYASMGNGIEGNDKLSEVFKYLSMCYVLTNSKEDSNDVINNIKMWIATDSLGTDEVEVFNLNNVPVQRNHRTNIVGSLLTAEAKVEIKVDQDFAGQKLNGAGEGKSVEIADGFYYDNDKKEFQISNLNGLLVFQSLVNGDLTVREQINEESLQPTVGGPYPYYPIDGEGDKTYYLKYKSYSKSQIKNADLFLKALNYGDTERANGYRIVEDTSNGGWPAMNNFSFYGCTVKLMADIDLEGIEWIPIGFDVASWDSSLAATYQPWKNINYGSVVDKNKNVTFTNRRVFAGKFDGNGHTIYNLKSKRFGSKVHESAIQEHSSGSNTNKTHYDCVQWFPQGFFGLVGGPDCEITNLRLQNVDIRGRNNVAGIVGNVSSPYGKTLIQNCIVDGGTIKAEPLYRGDEYGEFGRTTARGVYVAGIVGQYVGMPGTKDAIVDCEVRNVNIIGFRRMGGIVGGIADSEGDNMNKGVGENGIQLDIVIRNNTVSNTLILCDQFKPFADAHNWIGSKGVWQNGFGWGTGNGKDPNSDIFVGGLTKDNLGTYSSGSYSYENSTNFHGGGFDSYVTAINTKNSNSNVQFTVLSSISDGNNDKNHNFEGTKRTAIIDNVPLQYFPILSTWFTDEVTLNYNYYGNTNAKTRIDFEEDTNFWSKYSYSLSSPFNFPNSYDIQYDEGSGNAALYIESIKLNGNGDYNGGRSVITPVEVNNEGSCVAFVTARDRHQYVDILINANGALNNITEPVYKKPTEIQNVVFRGSPYAWAGMIVAPNENMSELVLDNVTIYDVYKTITLDGLKKHTYSVNDPTFDEHNQGYTDWWEYTYPTSKVDNRAGTVQESKADIELKVNNCNFRGFTEPGKGWAQITYTGTTFEQGAETKHSYADYPDDPVKQTEFKTCKVESPTTFDNCYFKAPFVIDLSNRGDNNKVEFINNCYASSAYKNAKINYDSTDDKYKDVQYIVVGTNIQQGITTITYLNGKKEKIENL